MFNLQTLQTNDDPASDDNTIFAIEGNGYRLFHVYERNLAELIVKLLNNAPVYEELVHAVIDSDNRELKDIVKGLL
jgi:hypothetical protein